MSIVYGLSAIGAITNNPGTGGTSITVTTGQGARFVNGSQSRRGRIYSLVDASTEDVRITNRSTDSITVVRNVDGRGALNIVASAFVIEDVDDLGPWKDVNPVASFDSSFYSQDTGTWTVQSADQVTLAGQRCGYTVNYAWKLQNTSSASSPVELRIAVTTVLLPNGAAFQVENAINVIENATPVDCIAYIAAASNVIGIQKKSGAAFSNLTNQLHVAGQLTIPAV